MWIRNTLRRIIITTAKFSIEGQSSKKMSSIATSATPESSAVFVQRFNPITGMTDWITQHQDYDYHQEIARAAYADMLHDHDRNMKYYEGLKIAVQLKHRDGQEVIVLDIGTGTGLLSMMAVSCGADRVFACEAFKPMAECAQKVLERNGMLDKVTLIPKRSTDIVVPTDLPIRANILVTEVFDTELIGEGAIQTFNHANKHLLTDDCIVIPTRAILYAQVVDCPQVPIWNSLSPISLPNGNTINFSKEIAECHGIPSVHDVQLSEIKPGQFTALSKPLPVFEFDWNNANGPIPHLGRSALEFKAENAGTTNAIFSWWDLIMDPLGKNIITCRPTWAGGEDLAWRDHWMQAIYYHPKPLDLVAGKDYNLKSFHDEYSLWFEVACGSPAPSGSGDAGEDLQRPICQCSLHTVLGRSRIGMWNDTGRNEKFIKVLNEQISNRNETNVLVLSEGSPLSLIAAGLGATKVFVIEPNCGSKGLKDLVAFNKFEDRIVFLKDTLDLDIIKQQIGDSHIHIVVGDPFFSNSVLPWHNLSYWFSIRNFELKKTKSVLKLFPCKAILKGILVDFEHLWKIKAPVGRPCNGEWDLQDFDDLILKSSTITDSLIDAQPLWEYPGLARSLPFEILSFDFTQEKIENVENVVTLRDISSGTYNGVAFWMEWVLDEERRITVSDGPISEAEVKINSPINWNMNSKQGVYFTWKRPKYSENVFECTTSFSKESGEIVFQF